MTRVGPAEERDICPDGRGELPVRRRRGRWGPRHGRSGGRADGRARQPRRRRGQCACLSRRRGRLGGILVAGARPLLALLAPGHPAAQRPDGPRDRGRSIPAPDPGPAPVLGAGPPRRRDDAAARQHPHPASVQPALAVRPPGPAGVAWLAGLAQAPRLMAQRSGWLIHVPVTQCRSACFDREEPYSSGGGAGGAAESLVHSRDPPIPTRPSLHTT